MTANVNKIANGKKSTLAKPRLVTWMQHVLLHGILRQTSSSACALRTEPTVQGKSMQKASAGASVGTSVVGSEDFANPESGEPEKTASPGTWSTSMISQHVSMLSTPFEVAGNA
mmetsp:Transcript_68633/g.134818  ORF Transcript_68633/g.134818 Transcript_68633/m.134818 type:complete len:114 (-) Transcript_68633:1062-1403(-)